MTRSQPGILAPLPKLARYLKFSLMSGAKPRTALLGLTRLADGSQIVVGIGQPAALALGKTIEGLRTFPAHFGAGLVLPSTPWAEGTRGGLNFVAFGKSFDAFEAQLKRMVGAEDGITDALFKFTQAVSGSYFWCPPTQRGKLVLRDLGLGRSRCP